MKAVVQDLKSGKLAVANVPPPALKPDGVLVRVHRSLVSLGTERAVIALANKGPLGKAMDRPDLAQKVLNKAKQEGFWSTYKVVKNLISSPIPLGYSCSGEVVQVGSEVGEFRVGDAVACAGLNFANHAEFDYVPRNLTVRVPDGLAHDSACFVTLGAIAMQGVRLANIELGEKVVVLGLGLVGQLAAQLARAAGATVIATDLDPDKTAMAKQLGAHHVHHRRHDLENAVHAATDGHGADVVLICASAKSNAPWKLAARVARLKGRVVLVGDVGMDFQRRPFFEKELSFVVSRSYGPGRYDPSYEVRGVEYPLPFVRWTEQRNMSSFLELVARGDVNVEPLITQRFPIDDAASAYDIVTGKSDEKAIAILFEYPTARLESNVVLKEPAAAKPGEVRLGVIGAGQFAKGVLLPAFARHGNLRFRSFCTSSGFTSKHVAEHYKAEQCTSEPADVIQDEHVNTVLIASRHDQHAPLTMDALRAGKAVFVEKPLALSEASLAAVQECLEQAESPRLMVGYNRRFSPLAIEMRKFFDGLSEPMFASYRVNALPPPPDSWVFDPVEGGGRILGEVCHFVDFLCFLTGSRPRRIHAVEIPQASKVLERDSLTITLTMENGSVGTIHYLGSGSARVPKEYVEAFGGGRTAILDNFRSVNLFEGNKKRTVRKVNQVKGHEEEVTAFLDHLAGKGPLPIDLETLIAVTQTTILVHRSLDRGGPVDYEPPCATTSS